MKHTSETISIVTYLFVPRCAMTLHSYTAFRWRSKQRSNPSINSEVDVLTTNT